MEESLKAYAAGFFDGEGSVIISKGHKYNRRYLRVHIGQIWPEVLEMLKDNWGGSVFQHKSRPHGRSFSEWVVTGTGAQKFLKDVYPWLIVKRTQARLAMYYPVGTKGNGVKVTPEVHAFRESLREAIMMQNKKRPITSTEVESRAGSNRLD